ncbi:uncharacterized protein LOC142330866 isoform X2 [Lycorma delicatula]
MLTLTFAGEYPCDLKKDVLNSQKINESPVLMAVDLQACGLICFRDPSEFTPAVNSGPVTLEEESAAILRTRSYTAIIHNSDSNTTDNYSYTLSADDLPLFRTPHPHETDARSNRKMKNSGHFRTSVRKLKTNTYFFPTSGLYNFSCLRDTDSAVNSCFIEKANSSIPLVIVPISEKLKVKIRSAPQENLLIVEKINTWQEDEKSLEFLNGTCTNEESSTESQMVSVPLLNPENSLVVDATLTMDSCQPSCLLTVARKDVCSNFEKNVEYDIRLTFWLYLIVRVFIGMISGTAFAMFEGAVIAILREHKADYGLQRIYAAIGGMISSPLSGMLIDYASQNKGYTDFRPAFYLYAGLKIISGALMLTINLEFKTPATNVVSDVLTVLKNIEIVALFITCFILGTAWGYIESFLFWLLQDLGASRSLMGITITIGGIAGLPLLVMSGPIIDRIGHANVLFIGFIFYAIRLLGYSLIYNPWMCLIFEAMESVTSSLAITAAVTYAAKLSTNTTDSSIQGLLGGLYFGVGKGAGSLIGGYLMQAVGTRPTYQIFSAVTLVTGCIYYLFNHFYIENRYQKKEMDEQMKGVSNAAFEKGREAKEITSNYNNLGKEGNHIIENIPLNTSSSMAKKYTNCDQSKLTKKDENQTKRNDLKQDVLGKSAMQPSCHINLGYDIDDENLLRNRVQNLDETKNKEKR